MKKYICLVLVLCASYNLHAQKRAENVDVVAFMKDVIVTTKSQQKMKQVWFLPGEYWAIALKDSPYAESGVLDDFMTQLTDYVVVAALDADISAYGSFLKNPVDISFTATDGKIYKPLENSDMGEEMLSVMAVIKPMMKAQLGQLGSSYEFFVFSAFDSENQAIADPYSTGEVSFNINDDILSIPLPLSALVEKKICPTGNKLLNGNWQFCPWHGTKLINQ